MKWWFLITVLIWFAAVPVYGADMENEKNETNIPAGEEQEKITEEETRNITDNLLEQLNLQDLNEIVNMMLEDTDLSFSDMVSKLVSGEWVLDADTLLELLGEVFYHELAEQKSIILELFFLILLAALLFQLSHLFEQGQMTNITFYMVYLMAFVLLMKSFRGLLGQAESVIGTTAAFMKVLTPAYFLAITASNGGLTASAYYQIVLITLTLIQSVLLKLAIPGIQMYVILGIVNDLSKEDFLSKLAELVKTLVLWMNRSVTGIVVGLQVIQRMIAPAMDLVKRGLVGKTASAIPGIGNIIDSVTEMTIGCAVLVRNCLGVAALLVLVIFGLGPMIQIGITALLYRLLSAVMQPVSDKRLIQAVTVMAEGCGMILRVLFTSEILFLLTIAIVASGGVQ